jgi:hypothetical protein
MLTGTTYLLYLIVVFTENLFVDVEIAVGSEMTVVATAVEMVGMIGEEMIGDTVVASCNPVPAASF